VTRYGNLTAKFCHLDLSKTIFIDVSLLTMPVMTMGPRGLTGETCLR